MGKTAFIFPGQGSQYVGMGKDFYEQIPLCAEVFALAQEASGLPVAKICFEPNEEIHVTKYTQIAMLAAARAMSDRDLFALVAKRGLYMQEAVPTGGAMTAVLGLDGDAVEEVCRRVDGQVSVANYNCPGQIVITGEAAAVEAAAQQLKEAGAKRCVPLQVSGPFHSPMLSGAGEKLEEELAGAEVFDPAIPYVANVTADYVTKKEEIKPLLARQVSASVRWQQTMERLIADGVTTFVEIGPGRTLSGFLKKIDRNITCLHVEKVEDIAAVKEALA